MMNETIHSFMTHSFGTCRYGIWLKDDYDVQWNNWLLVGEMPEYIEDRFPISDWKIFKYTFDFLSHCNIRVAVETHKQLTLLQSERLESLIREELLKQQIMEERVHNERWMKGLRELTCSLELNDLLLKIMENALKVIPSLSCGLFMMVDPESGKMIPRAKVGFQDSVFQYQGEIDEGITGKVYEEGIGRIYSNPEEAYKDMDNVNPENASIIVSALPNDSVAKGMIAVPVTMNTRKIGVMLVYQFTQYRRFAPHDLNVMQGFADQAAIAISNATMYSELLEKNRYLVSRNEIHNQFTKLSIEHGSLGHTIEKVGSMLHLPTYYIDMARGDWYPTIPESTVLDELNVYSVLENSFDPMTLPDDGNPDVYLYPIVYGSLMLGCFLIELRHPLRQLDHVILEQGGAIVTLEMMNTYSLTEMTYRKNQDFFADLVQYREPQQLESRLASFHLPAHQSLFVIQIQLQSEHLDMKTTENWVRKLIGFTEKELGTTEHLLFNTHNKITILAAASDPKIRLNVISTLEVAIQKWTTSKTPKLLMGIGGVYRGLEYVSKSNDEAARALSFLLKRNKVGMMLYEDIGINKLFLNQETSDIENYIHEVLAPLQQHKSGELELTLKTYIAENRSVQATAERLHIHSNTLYLRLRKIEEILGVDLNDSEGWMKIYLAFHLSEVYAVTHIPSI
ncbi:helix-turn-helix domain-containing protein [Paenibacillus sp. ACRSA]|uniref:helix-turn-helix domain-containing protein n=1 Tax=Paenibacillus sp. ACRSA TaxID=2918211 RepID=UPI001EF450C7|nr:helix-turn-helix domain-containing protein [Paenibacillus sp. ACRSA]MCG7377482.1 helix-turn-helix domain-containing protein [Paenibacillus sp. ACRSA]